MTTAIAGYTTAIRGVLMFLLRGVAGCRVTGPQGTRVSLQPGPARRRGGKLVTGSELARGDALVVHHALLRVVVENQVLCRSQ